MTDGPSSWGPMGELGGAPSSRLGTGPVLAVAGLREVSQKLNILLRIFVAVFYVDIGL